MSKRKDLFLMLLSKCIALLFLLVGPVATSQTWTKKPSQSINGRTIGYWEFLPASYATGSNYPVIIALHGLGEAGDGGSTALNTLLNQGVPALINASSFPYEAIVLCPQYSGSSMGLYDFNALVDYVISNYKSNPNKISLIGYSAGANSIIEVLAESYNSARISAFINCDVAYGYVPSIAQTMVTNTVISEWFHDTNDGYPVANAQNWVNGINGLGGTARLTTRTGAGHGYWATVISYGFNVYPGQDWAEWLIAQNLNSVATLSNTLVGKIGATVYRWKIYSDNTYTVETNNGTAWVSASAFTQKMRGKQSGVTYRWQFASNSTYTQQ